MSINLSVLICSTHTRSKTFLPIITDRIFSMYNLLSKEQQDQVEIIILTDNKKMMLGEKRNIMVNMAQGLYVVFIDDDDRLDDSYLLELLEATMSDADALIFEVSVTINGENPKICKYSKEYKKDYNTPDNYFRLPNHICAVKKSISEKSSFPNILYGEDAGYSKRLAPFIKTEYHIPKVLYHYDFDVRTTEAQLHLRAQKPRNRNLTNKKVLPLVDVIILSNAKTEKLKELTEQTILSCLIGANWLPINIVVIEQNPACGHYEYCKTFIREDAFNYNEFANLGASKGSADWILIANNDLIFNDGWLHKLLNANNPVVSPRCPKDKRQAHIQENEKGYKNGVHFSGWCFMIQRELWKQINGFDTDVSFWCSDDVVIEQVREAGVEPMIVHDALVEHVGSSTLNTLPQNEQNRLTMQQVKKFNKKYHQNKFGWGT